MTDITVTDLLFGIVFASWAVMSLGGFYYNGAVRYIGGNNITNLALFNVSNDLYVEINNSQGLLAGGNIQTGSNTGNFLTSAATVSFNFITGKYLSIVIEFVNDVIGYDFIVIPSWIIASINMIITFIFVVSVVSTFVGRKV